MSLDVSLVKTQLTEVYSANITHNLVNMAKHAGVYGALWQPHEYGYMYARDIIPILQEGLSELKAYPDLYKRYSSPNGWGKYENFVPFVENYLNACTENPDAEINVSR